MHARIEERRARIARKPASEAFGAALTDLLSRIEANDAEIAKLELQCRDVRLASVRAGLQFSHSAVRAALTTEGAAQTLMPHIADLLSSLSAMAKQIVRDRGELAVSPGSCAPVGGDGARAEP